MSTRPLGAALERIRRPVSPEGYRRVTLLAVALLALIVVTGAAVRLTGSGLGCSDWPRCTDQHFVATSGLHADIEFGNRALTGVVSVVVIAAVLASTRRSPRRRDLTWLSGGLVAGVVAQIILGKFVVVSHLNPWVVQGHFVASMALLLDAVVLNVRAGRPDGVAVRPVVTPALLAWGRALAVLAGIVLLTGTIVTGSGPHSGENQGVPIDRLPIHAHDAARIHGTAMLAFLGATIWVLVQLRRHHAGRPIEGAVRALLTVLTLQAALGYTQYFSGVPPALVGLHVVGACLVWIAVLQVALHMQRPIDAAVEDQVPGPAQSSGAAHRTARVADGDLVPGR
ncbi:MAG: cytochrome oxidase assembly [Actinomycetia bacterium]|nr:cytochrome oxidase assembly [Actinomycetes bacterium]